MLSILLSPHLFPNARNLHYLNLLKLHFRVMRANAQPLVISELPRGIAAQVLVISLVVHEQPCIEMSSHMIGSDLDPRRVRLADINRAIHLGGIILFRLSVNGLDSSNVAAGVERQTKRPARFFIARSDQQN